MCISIQNQTEVVVFYLGITYFQFQLQLSVCFYTMPDWTSITNFWIFNWKILSKTKLST